MKYFTQLMEEATPPEGGNSQGGGEVSTPTWYYSAPNAEAQFEGVGGNGEVPEWFNVAKYTSVEEQAKAQRELEKRFGGFEGAPEKYELTEELADLADDPLMQKIMEFGKEKQMGNSTLNELVGIYTSMQAEAQEKATQQAMEALGPQAQERIQNVQNWLNTNAPKEIIDMVAPMATSAEAIQAIEFFINKTKGSTVAPQNSAPQAQVSQAEYAEMLMATDKLGQLKMNTDPSYRKKMDELAKSFM